MEATIWDSGSKVWGLGCNEELNENEMDIGKLTVR